MCIETNSIFDVKIIEWLMPPIREKENENHLKIESTKFAFHMMNNIVNLEWGRETESERVGAKKVAKIIYSVIWCPQYCDFPFVPFHSEQIYNLYTKLHIEAIPASGLPIGRKNFISIIKYYLYFTVEWNCRLSNRVIGHCLSFAMLNRLWNGNE